MSRSDTNTVDFKFCDDGFVWTFAGRRNPITRMRSAFKTYKKCVERCKMMEGRRRQGTFGIGVECDPAAREWQRWSFRLERVEAWIMGKPTNWYCAKFLSVDEASKRMDSSLEVEL